VPSPEQLGIAASSKPAAQAVDWTDARRRLDELGAVGFNLQKLADDRYQFTVLVPLAESTKTRRVEATAGTEAEAVRLALARVGK
jgi:hypothetical protein